MPEAVIVATARSPIGRAFKGSLTTIRPDDLTGQMVTAALAKVPQLDPADIDDLILGCGLPGGEQGFNMARVVAVMLGLRPPARHDDHPVLLVLAADHPDGVPRDQGRRGRRVHLGGRRVREPVRQGQQRQLAGHQEPGVRRRPRTGREARSGAGAPVWHDPREDGEVPDVYIAMGQTAENVAQLRGISREEQDEFGVRSQNLAEKAIANGFWQRDITPVTLPDGTVVSADDGPRAGHHAGEGGRRCSRCSGRTARSPRATAARSTTAPPRVVVMSDRKAAELGHHPAGADRVHRRDRRCRRRSWGWARSRRPGRRWPGPA